MARSVYGGRGGDFVVSTTGTPMPGDTGTVWTAKTGGSQVTDLLAEDGSALATPGVIVAGAHGEVTFQGPDSTSSGLWVDFGGGIRVLVEPRVTSGTGTVTSVTAGNGTITVAGTATDPTIAATVGTTSGTVAAGDHAHATYVTSVNSETGAVTLDSDDISDTGKTHQFTTAAEASKLAGIEAGADVTDATNVAAAGAVMTSLVTAKGDSIWATGSGAVDNLAVGTNEYILTADSSQTLGVRWAIAPAQPINAQTGTTYTIVLGDVGKLVTCSNSGAITVTLPQDSDVAFPTGVRIDFLVINTGMVTFAAGTGATVNATPSAVSRAQWSAVTAIKRAANTWTVVGDLA